MDHDDSSALLHVLGASNTLSGARRRSSGSLAGAISRRSSGRSTLGSTTSYGALLAGGAAGAIHRDHAPGDGTRSPDRPDDQARGDRDRHPRPAGAGRGVDGPPERYRTEPVVPARESWRAGRDPGRDPGCDLGHRLRGGATSSIATSGACASSCRTATGIRASSPPSRGWAISSSPCSRTWDGAASKGQLEASAH